MPPGYLAWLPATPQRKSKLWAPRAEAVVHWEQGARGVRPALPGGPEERAGAPRVGGTAAPGSSRGQFRAVDGGRLEEQRRTHHCKLSGNCSEGGPGTYLPVSRLGLEQARLSRRKQFSWSGVVRGLGSPGGRALSC